MNLEESYPNDIIVLAADWADTLYDRIHKITLKFPSGKTSLLAESSLKHTGIKDKSANFELKLIDGTLSFSVVLGGEKGFKIEGLDSASVSVEGLKSIAIPLEQFFQENPPTMFLLNGCTISGCVYTDYGESDVLNIPSDRIEALSWDGVDYTVESHYKGSIPRDDSIQEYMMKRLVHSGAKIVFNDDNPGESADIVAIFIEEDTIRFELVHCKYSKTTSGARLSDLYEVCGQVIVSLRYKWKPEDLVRHLERRNALH